MSESTHQGDSTDVDAVAQALLSRRTTPQPDPAPEAEEKTPEALEAEAVEEVEETDSTEAEELEADSTAEPEDESDAEETEASPQFETLAELADATGMEYDEFLKSIRATTNVMGEKSEKSLADVLKGYQLESTFTRNNEAFLAKKTEFEESVKAREAKLYEDMQRTGALLNMAQNQLTHEFNAINWNQLEQEDPAEWAKSRQQFGERQAQINQAVSQATMQAQQVQQKQQAETAARQEQYLAEQDELLLKALPEWNDVSKREAQAKDVAVFLQGEGFSPEEVANVSDHRIILLARKAMQAIEQADQKKIAQKKVKKTPRLVKSKARQNPKQAKQRQVDKAVETAQKTGRVDDVAAALLAKRRNKR